MTDQLSTCFQRTATEEDECGPACRSPVGWSGQQPPDSVAHSPLQTICFSDFDFFCVCVTVRDENGVSSKVQCAAPSLMRCLGGARSLQKLEGFE